MRNSVKGVVGNKGQGETEVELGAFQSKGIALKTTAHRGICMLFSMPGSVSAWGEWEGKRLEKLIEPKW